MSPAVAYASTVNLNLLFRTQHGHGVRRFSTFLCGYKHRQWRRRERGRGRRQIFSQSWQGSNTLRLNVNQFFLDSTRKKKWGLWLRSEHSSGSDFIREKCRREKWNAWDHFKLMRRALISVIVLMLAFSFFPIFFSFSLARPDKKSREIAFFCGDPSSN